MEIPEPLSILSTIINVFFVIASLSTLFYLMWGGLEWITAGGDRDTVDQARNKITSAIIRIILLTAALSVLRLSTWLINSSITLPTPADIATIFTFIINLVIGVGWSLVIVMVFLGFLQYGIAQGDPTTIEESRQWLIYAFVGGIAIFMVMIVRNILPSLLTLEDTTARITEWVTFLFAVFTTLGSVLLVLRLKKRAARREEEHRAHIKEQYPTIFEDENQ